MSIQRRSDELVDLLRPDFVGNDGTASPSFVWVCVQAGTAAAPGFRFCADPDTGFYRRGANEIGIATQGIARGFWGPGLNIGATATGALAGDVHTAGDNALIQIKNTKVGVAGLSYLEFRDDAAALNLQIGTANDTKAFFANKQNGDIGFETNAVESMTLSAVGILSINNVTGALRLPNMTTVQRLALAAVNGMMVYDSTVGAIYGYEAGAWVNL